MALEAEIAKSAAQLMRFNAVQSGIRAQRYTSATLYFAMASASQTIQDLAMKALQAGNVEAIEAAIPSLITHDLGLGLTLKDKEGADVAYEVLQALKRDYKGHYDNWQAGIWHGVGNVYAASMENFMGTGDLLWAYKHLANRIAITPKMERHWMSVYRPTLPNLSMAWELLKRGLITEATYNTLASYEGFSDEWSGKLKTSFETWPTAHMAFRMKARGQLTDEEFKKYAEAEGWPSGFDQKIAGIYEWWPSSQEAYYLWRKGIIDKDTRDKFYTGQGWPKDMHNKITENYDVQPSPREAFYMWRKGIIDLAERNKIYAASGIPADLYAEVTRNFFYTPSIAEAFYMWKRGIINIGERDSILRANGVADADIVDIVTNQYYVPTLYDLIRMADYEELDLIWATRLLQERGLRAKDITKIINHLKIRPLREEVRNLTDQLVWRYEHGRIIKAELESELDKLPIGTTEKSLLVDYAEYKYEDELITEQMDILKWRFRMAWITEDDYLAELINLGIREEKANLIVEAEKAQGYFGYY